ncbi:hypothetical protein SAMN00790413_04057 [Deinococcus hopiensis KR-140]|uniref:Uncharacterized protein n=1 Tax=Deinococcus hopiensis KR-140 TaxID=695939 RepID=A0A1W1UN80_9DEIO|nr:hypothetical protein SAMN00790413_04057 [Deinococcus hopiensis KR-140]
MGHLPEVSGLPSSRTPTGISTRTGFRSLILLGSACLHPWQMTHERLCSNDAARGRASLTAPQSPHAHSGSLAGPGQKEVFFLNTALRSRFKRRELAGEEKGARTRVFAFGGLDGVGVGSPAGVDGRPARCFAARAPGSGRSAAGMAFALARRHRCRVHSSGAGRRGCGAPGFPGGAARRREMTAVHSSAQQRRSGRVCLGAPGPHARESGAAGMQRRELSRLIPCAPGRPAPHADDGRPHAASPRRPVTRPATSPARR